MTGRQDPHCVQNFDPADYVYDSSMSVHEIPDFESDFLIELGDQVCEQLIQDRNKLAEYRQHWIQRIDREGFQQGNFINRRTCDHCGAWMKFSQCYQHTPTQQLIAIGSSCAENRFGQDYGAEDILAIQKQVHGIEIYGLKSKKIRAILDASEGLEEAIKYDAYHVVRSIKISLLTYGKISGKQIKLVHKAVLGKWEDAPPAEYEKEPTPTEPLVGGKRILEGTVLGIKQKEGAYGPVWKMMLKLECGNRVFGTIAKQLIDEADLEDVQLKGCRVRFIAIVKLIEGKPNFGYFSRPKEAEILELSKREKG